MDKVLAFASGSNHPGEIRGFAAVGQPVGVAAPECRSACEQALLSLAGAGVPVFVDSGAFSEVVFGPRGPRVVRPISHDEWLERLALYQRLADALGDSLYAVAPDMVGSQERTLERLQSYGNQIRKIHDAGAHILVPFQRGPMSLHEFDQRVQKILGFSDYVVAFPMKKGATEPESIAGFLAYRRPHQIHLLGLGAKNPQAAAVVDMIHELSPQTRVSIDSNRLKAYVGWEYGRYKTRMEKLGIKPMSKAEWLPQHHVIVIPGFRTVPDVSPREYTLAREFVGPLNPRFALELGNVHQEDLGLEELGIPVMTDEEMVYRVDEWLTPDLREEIWRQRELGDLWEEYEWDVVYRKTGDVQRPPERDWYPFHDQFPSPDDLPYVGGPDPEVAFADFMRKPSTWVLGRYFHQSPKPAKLTDANVREMADMLRPFYLEHLGRQRIDGSTVAATWRKKKAIEAAFGRGTQAEAFERWKKRLRSITNQRDYEMQMALSHHLRPRPLSFAEREVIHRGTRYPEFEELVLRHWDQVAQRQGWHGFHYVREQDRARRILYARYGSEWLQHRDHDPYHRWLESLRNVSEDERNELLRRVVAMRVAQRKGKAAVVLPGVPEGAMEKPMEDYRSPPEYDLGGYERVANAAPVRRSSLRPRQHSGSPTVNRLRRRLLR